MIDRRGDQLGKVLVCVHAVTIQHRGRATRSIDHDTHGHRLGQDKAHAGFEGSQEARALDQEVAITSPPSSVRLVSTRSRMLCVLLKRKRGEGWVLLTEKAESEAQRG